MMFEKTLSKKVGEIWPWHCPSHQPDQQKPALDSLLK